MRVGKCFDFPGLAFTSSVAFLLHFLFMTKYGVIEHQDRAVSHNNAQRFFRILENWVM